MKIQFLNLKISDSIVEKEIKEIVLDIISRREFILGREVKQFEEEFARYIGTKYAVSVSSGTTALFLSLKSLNISQGDFVITTPFTFTATGEVIIHCGATPVFIDIDEKTYNIDPEKIEHWIKNQPPYMKEKIKSIIPVHLYGHPAEMDTIMDIAKRYELYVVEDAAQSHGAEYKFKIQNSKFKIQKVGSIGHTGCFSFYPTKNLGGYGDGGIVTTNDEKLYQSVLQLRNHGRIEHYLYQQPGYNARLNNLQAGVLLVKLKYLDQWNKERQKIASIYTENLSCVGDIITPFVFKKVTHVYHLYVIRTKYRDSLQRFLRDNNIDTSIQYQIPLHLQPAYKNLCLADGKLEKVETIAKEVLSLPIYPGLKESQIGFIIKKIKEFFKNYKKYI